VVRPPLEMAGILADDGLVLGLGHRRHPQVERLADLHVMTRLLIIECLIVIVRRAHPELAGRDPLQSDLPDAGRDEVRCRSSFSRLARSTYLELPDTGGDDVRGATRRSGKVPGL